MKLMIASDIHGHGECCAEMFARFKEENADKLLILGDLLMVLIDPRINFGKKEGGR